MDADERLPHHGVFPEDRREPLDAASPLWDLPNVLVSPHTASHSLGQNEAIFGIFLDNLARFRAGQALRNDVDNLG
jgi:phosphoglycerate dehydrogenase-like enzyme